MTTGDITLVLNRLSGSTLAIPNLDPVYSHWKSGINPNYKQLIPVINELLKKSFHNEVHVQRLKSMDFALCASL